jgi:hypothetical protein
MQEGFSNWWTNVKQDWNEIRSGLSSPDLERAVAILMNQCANNNEIAAIQDLATMMNIKVGGLQDNTSPQSGATQSSNQQNTSFNTSNNTDGYGTPSGAPQPENQDGSMGQDYVNRVNDEMGGSTWYNNNQPINSVD